MALPGDKNTKQYIEEAIRVNHAGEYGAKRIYEGQLAILKKSPNREIIENMAQQEQKHLEYFEQQLVARKIRPTALFPFWHVAGFLLGAGSALISEKAAMACTEAIEEVIDKHYEAQLNKIDSSEQELKNKISKFREEENEHKNIAIENQAHNAFAYPLLTRVIKAGCRLSIFLAKKI